MRRIALALGLAVIGGAAIAQEPVAGAPNPFSMPGQTVGSPSVAKPILKPVGNRLPGAVPQAGTPISGLATAKPGAIGPGAMGAERPQGTPIDLKNVVAPYPGMPKEQTFWTKLEDRWFALFESDTPAVRPNYTPGIGRRNKERREERMKRWD